MALFGTNDDSAVAALTLRVTQLEQRVEQLAQLVGAPAAQTPPPDPRMDEVLRLKQAGKDIQAIKLLREIQPGLGLADAKALVDQM